MNPDIFRVKGEFSSRRSDSVLRLRSQREQTEAVGQTMQQEAERFDRLKNRETRAVSAFNLFQTPEPLARQMAAVLRDLMGGLSGLSILEPSAGLGRLVHSIAANGSNNQITMVEQNSQLCGELYSIGNLPESNTTRLIQGDFLSQTMDRLGTFDAVLMNPPFKNGIDRRHLFHAYGLLKTGGWLVGLCANGPRQIRDIQPKVDHWQVLPEGSFKSEGTGVSVAMVVWKRV